MTQELGPVAPATPRRDLARGGLVLALSVGLNHGLHYGYNVVMAAALGPASFGALGALLALILLGSVPGIALQAVQPATPPLASPGAIRGRHGGRCCAWRAGGVWPSPLLRAMPRSEAPPRKPSSGGRSR